MKVTLSSFEDYCLLDQAPRYPLLRLKKYLECEVSSEEPLINLTFRQRIKRYIRDFYQNPSLETAVKLKNFYDEQVKLKQVDNDLPFNLNDFFTRELPDLIREYKDSSIIDRSIEDRCSIKIADNLLKKIKQSSHQYYNNLKEEIVQVKNPIVGMGVCQGVALAKCSDILQSKKAIKCMPYSNDVSFYLRAEIYQFKSHLKNEIAIYDKLKQPIIDEIEKLKGQQNAITEKIEKLKAQQNSITEKIEKLEVQQNAITKKVEKFHEQIMSCYDDSRKLDEQIMSCYDDSRKLNEQIMAYYDKIQQGCGGKELSLGAKTLVFKEAKLSFKTPNNASKFIASNIIEVLQQIPIEQNYSFNLHVGPNVPGTGHSMGIVKTKEKLIFIDANLGVFEFNVNEISKFKDFIAWELYEIGYCHIFNEYQLKSWPELEEQLPTPEILKNLAEQNKQPVNQSSRNKITSMLNKIRDIGNYNVTAVRSIYNVSKSVLFSRGSSKRSIAAKPDNQIFSISPSIIYPKFTTKTIKYASYDEQYLTRNKRRKLN